ncbi:CDP-diacylglycerol--inositol 3-phosphatidyltransferase [Rhincodon typus]|uniref:CDP-diacylglycerol--inositol 3-phosphatidyltransferase n=1 Tax=Rhincodon typus TaxID=259920 RepID=UPI00202EF4B8|nr:CDP-diacylglycerol--inositol 3-phosphatidyltransferase [Rhincodon typus]
MVSVFLFVPNLIGYSRIFLALAAFYFMPSSPKLATGLYLLSSFLDSFDGHAARLLNQCSRFGMMLDMLTDRCATMCLLVNLSLLYPRYVFLFQLSMSLDISSHWLHLHRSVILPQIHPGDTGLVPSLNIHFFQLLLYCSFPICAIKTAISVIHLITAARNMAAMDQAEGEQGLASRKQD